MPLGPTPDEIRSALACVLESSRFREAPRISAFLRFVVERWLAGEPELIKETVIAMEVYGRSSTFNPQADSIVRVEAGRLRSKLRDYYLTEGRDDAVRIELPKGSYVPVFEALQIPEPVNESASSEKPAPAALRGRPFARLAWTAVVVCLLGVIIYSVWSARTQGSAAIPSPARRVAVLPFTDLSEGRRLAYFCDGLAEEMIDDLSRVPGLSVLARGSSFQFRGSDVDAREVGRRLQVDRVLLGSVRQSGSKVRVSAQLVDSSTGLTLWSSSYDRDSRDALAVQDEIAREVARSLEVQMSARASAAPPADPAAYELYLKGRYYYWKSNADDETRALNHFEEAVQKDPSFAPAWAGIADVLASTPLRGVQVDQAMVDRARAAARKALELDPQLLDGILAQAHLARTMDYDWREAERLYRRALALQPGAARPHNSYGVLLSLSGRFDEADRELREAMRLDPLSMQVHSNLVLNLYRQRRYSEAVAEARKAAAIEPSYRNIYSPMAAALAEMGQFRESFAALDLLTRNSSGQLLDHHLALRGHILARSGDITGARAVLHELETRTASRYVPKSAIADVLLALGEKDRALELMESAIGTREVLLAGLLVSPHSDPVRSDTRFVQLTQRIARR